MLVGGLPLRAAIGEGIDAHFDHRVRQRFQLLQRGWRRPAVGLKERLVIDEDHALVGERNAVEFTFDDAGLVRPGQQLLLPAQFGGIIGEGQHQTGRDEFGNERRARCLENVRRFTGGKGRAQLVVQVLLADQLKLNVGMGCIERLDERLLQVIHVYKDFRPPGDGDFFLPLHHAETQQQRDNHK